jgi:Fe-S oxidoreductase
VLDFTRLIDQVAALPDGSLAHEGSRDLAYHDSCQGLNALGIQDAPRRILGGVLGHDVHNLAEPAVCCGFGGSFSFDYPTISERLMTRKLDDAQATGVKEIVTDNQGCILQLRGGSDAQGRQIVVRHIAQLLLEGIEATAARSPAVAAARESSDSDSPATT